MAKIGVGVIGTGFAGASHVDALRRLPEVELVAVAASGREKAERAAAAYGACRAVGDYQELLADDGVAAVHNCTPNHLHVEVN
jgi:predicted dehydrogenase